MARRDEEDVRRGVERTQFGAYDGEGHEHGEPREFHYGAGFDEPEHGRWADQHEVDVFTLPYDRWTAPGYVFYAGKGYHREFIDPYATAVDPRDFAPQGLEPEGGMGFQVVRERQLRRREPGRFAGRGPKGYARSEARIYEDVNERLAEHAEIDATNVTVRVSEREVVLEGTVPDRESKRLAEDVAESVRGVLDVQNRLRVEPREIDVDVHGSESRSGTGFLTENLEVPRRRNR